MSLLKLLLIRIISIILWIIDPYHRNREDIAMDDMKKFTHVENVDFVSDFGIAEKAFRTVPYQVWELQTETKTLLGADRHRVIRDDHTAAWLEDLKPGDRLKTDVGIERVISCRSLGIRTHMYCLEVNTENTNDPNDHLFYSDGILSHNTTTAGAYLLWLAMFQPDTKILIAANKLKSALEVMSRIKYAYAECPDYIKAGSSKHNESTIQFDNGSIIEAVATTTDAARGKSLNFLYLDEFAFVPSNMASKFWTAVQPTLSTGGSCIITSTPRTDEDEFAQIWKGAQVKTDEYGNDTGKLTGKNDFFGISVPWWEHPELDEEWAKPFRESLGQARFSQEFECVVHNSIIEVSDNQNGNRLVSIGKLYEEMKLWNQNSLTE